MYEGGNLVDTKDGKAHRIKHTMVQPEIFP
jgi:hypothetical protein